MQDIIEQVFDHVRSAWRFRWYGLTLATLAALGGWFFVFSLPDRYDATASVFVDTRTALRPVLEGLIVQDDVMSQLGYVRQSILSGPRMEKIAVEAGVLPEKGVDPRKTAEVVSSLASHVAIEAKLASADAYESSGTIYSITYSDNDLDRAVRVTKTVMDTFIQDTLGGKQESTETTQNFLREQIKIYEDLLDKQDNALAEFKKKNLGLMPNNQGDYFSRFQAEIDAAKNSQYALDVATARRSELARQLQGGLSDSLAGAAAIPQGPSPETALRIRDAQSRLDELMLRFTERHPEVIEARNSLAELQARGKAEVESLRRAGAGSAAATAGLASNPVYQNTQLQLNQADVDIASLRGQVVQHNAKAAELRQLLDTAPKVEAEYAQLNRDYDLNRANYAALLANYDKARLGERADNAGGVRFQIVQPPIAQLAATSVHRNLLLVAVLIAALLAGGALTFAASLLRPVVSSARDLTQLTGFPVVGVVSAAFPHRLHVEARWSALRFGVASSLLLFGFVAALLLNGLGFRVASLTGGAG